MDKLDAVDAFWDHIESSDTLRELLHGNGAGPLLGELKRVVSAQRSKAVVMRLLGLKGAGKSTLARVVAYSPEDAASFREKDLPYGASGPADTAVPAYIGTRASLKEAVEASGQLWVDDDANAVAVLKSEAQALAALKRRGDNSNNGGANSGEPPLVDGRAMHAVLPAEEKTFDTSEDTVGKAEAALHKFYCDLPSQQLVVVDGPETWKSMCTFQDDDEKQRFYVAVERAELRLSEAAARDLEHVVFVDTPHHAIEGGYYMKREPLSVDVFVMSNAGRGAEKFGKLEHQAAIDDAVAQGRPIVLVATHIDGGSLGDDLIRYKPGDMVHAAAVLQLRTFEKKDVTEEWVGRLLRVYKAPSRKRSRDESQPTESEEFVSRAKAELEKLVAACKRLEVEGILQKRIHTHYEKHPEAVERVRVVALDAVGCKNYTENEYVASDGIDAFDLHRVRSILAQAAEDVRVGANRALEEDTRRVLGLLSSILDAMRADRTQVHMDDVRESLNQVPGQVAAALEATVAQLWRTELEQAQDRVKPSAKRAVMESVDSMFAQPSRGGFYIQSIKAALKSACNEHLYVTNPAASQREKSKQLLINDRLARAVLSPLKDEPVRNILTDSQEESFRVRVAEHVRAAVDGLVTTFNLGENAEELLLNPVTVVAAQLANDALEGTKAVLDEFGRCRDNPTVRALSAVLVKMQPLYQQLITITGEGQREETQSQWKAGLNAPVAGGDGLLLKDALVEAVMEANRASLANSLTALQDSARDLASGAMREFIEPLFQARSEARAAIHVPDLDELYERLQGALQAMAPVDALAAMQE